VPALLARRYLPAIVHHYGRDEFLRPLAHPLRAVTGVDGHSLISASG
jgi:hypothetical protein